MNKHEKQSRAHQVRGEADLRIGRPDLANLRFTLARLEIARADREKR